jgi:hypothetical protein
MAIKPEWKHRLGECNRNGLYHSNLYTTKHYTRYDVL